MSPESLVSKEEDPKLQQILEKYGDVKIRNPHFGLPGHENDPETMLVSETPEKCPPFITALLRAENEEKRRQIINIYRVE
jgi:hypothetical protein